MGMIAKSSCVALLAVGMLMAEGTVNAEIIVDSDDASAAVYDDGWNGFDDGSINPNGLGGWILGGNATDASTIGIGSSLGLGGGSDAIDSGGEAFKIHDPTGGFVDVFRFLDPAGLNVGETFSMDLAVNFRGGFKGLDLRDNSEATIFNFNIGGDDYSVGSAATGNGSIGNAYSNNTVFHLEFEQTGLAGGTWSITRSGGVNDFDTGTYSGLVSSFKLYSGDQGNAAEDAIYYNNLLITSIPEPASLTQFGICVAALLGYRRRS